MTATDLHDALDTLARLADHDPAPDRLAGITRKRQAQRNRRAAVGAGVAALAVIATSIGVAAIPGGGDADGQVATPAPTPEAPEMVVTMRVEPAGNETFRVSYHLGGTSLSVRDATTGDPIDHGGPLGTRVLLDGKDVGGSDGGAIECDPQGTTERYDADFGPVVVPVGAGQHTLSVAVDYCGAGGERLTATDRQGSYFMGTAQVADRARKDLDGDGTVERLVLVDEGTASALEISGGSVEGRVDFDAADPIWISGVNDLDGDGNQEVFVDARDGRLTRTFVVTVVDGEPRAAIPAAGSPSLLNRQADGRFFGSGVFNGVLTSWTGQVDTAWDPGTEETMPLTVPLDGGTWSLDGTTLRFTPWSTPHCGAPNGGAVEC